MEDTFSYIMTVLNLSGFIFILGGSSWSLCTLWQENRLVGYTCVCGWFLWGALGWGLIVPIVCAMGMSLVKSCEMTTEQITPPLIMWLTGFGLQLFVIFAFAAMESGACS